MHLRKTALLIMTFYATFAMSQTKIIAHRGYWDTKGSAQNSITALLKADSLGIYGSEFDVRVSKDSVLVINHDPGIWGHNVAHTSAKVLTSLKLKNKEPLPTLIDYFEAARPLSTKLILELKELESQEMESYAIEKILELVKEYQYEDRIEFISFSLHAIKEMVQKAPDIPTYYLKGELSPQELKEIGCTGPDYHYNVFLKNPNWIRECHELGLKVNTWTVNKEKEMKQLIELGVDFMTTDKPSLLRDLLEKTP